MTRSARAQVSSTAGPNQDHEGPDSENDQDPVGHRSISWKSIGTTAASVGVPAGVGLLHPVIGEIVLFVELAVTLIILATALFGTQKYSERAFRLMRWVANRPEPEAPPASTERVPGHGLPLGPQEAKHREPAAAELTAIASDRASGEPEEESPTPAVVRPAS